MALREEEELGSDQEPDFDPDNLLVENDTKQTIRLYRKIVSSYPEEDLLRANEQENGLGFEDYKHFCKMQIRMLRRANHNKYFNWLLRQIARQEIKVMDKESNVAFYMSGFCYDACKEIVFFNER